MIGRTEYLNRLITWREKKLIKVVTGVRRCGRKYKNTKREGITDVSLLESIVKFVASSIGSPISAKKISDTIRAGGRKLSGSIIW